MFSHKLLVILAMMSLCDLIVCRLKTYWLSIKVTRVFKKTLILWIPCFFNEDSHSQRPATLASIRSILLEFPSWILEVIFRHAIYMSTIASNLV